MIDDVEHSRYCRERRIEAEQRQARSKKKQELKKRIAVLEKEIADLEAQERDYAAELEKPETYEKPGRVMEMNRELSDIQDRLAELTPKWEHAATRLAELEQG